jgi:hypothetical protein
MICEKCGEELVVGSWPFCRGGHAPGTANVIGDEIDISTDNISGHMERFRSRARMNQRMREFGVMPYVRHVGEPGSDKSKATTRWT